MTNLFKIILVLLVLITEVHAFSNYDEAYTEAVNLANIAEKLESNSQFDEAIEYYKKVEKIFSEFNDENSVAVTKAKIGVVYAKKGEFDVALEYLREAREIHHKFNDINGEIATIGNSGNTYALKGDLDKALSLYNEAYALSQKIGDKHGEIVALTNIGNALSKKGMYYKEKEDYNLAIEYYNKALDVFLNISDLHNAGKQDILIASAYSRLRDWSKAEEYVEQAKNIFESINDKSGLEEVSLTYGDIYYEIANYYLGIEDLTKSIENFYLAEEEYKKVIDSPQAKLSYAYTLMKEGDLFSRNESHDEAINKFNEALWVLRGISNGSYNEQILLDVDNLILAKINFEKGIKEANNLNFIDAVKHFENSENKFKEILNASSMIDKKKLIAGYSYYSSSKKNYFLFKTTGNEGYRTLSQDDLRKAKDLFEGAGFSYLAKNIIEEKMINFPESFIPYKDYILLFQVICFQKIQFRENVLIFETSYITFNYGYIFKVPYGGLPAIRFCCDEFCSEWIKIMDNEIRETKIKIWSDYPRKLNCDIKIYSENKPELPIGKIEDFYYPTWKFEPKIQDNNIIFEIVAEYHYKKVSINIDKPLHEKIVDILKLPQTILSIIGGLIVISSVYKKRSYIKNKLKSIYLKIKNFIKASKNAK